MNGAPTQQFSWRSLVACSAVFALAACDSSTAPEPVVRDVTIAPTQSAFSISQTPYFAITNHRSVTLIVDFCLGELQVRVFGIWLPLPQETSCDGIPVSIPPGGTRASYIGGYSRLNPGIYRGRYRLLRWTDGQTSAVEASAAVALVRREVPVNLAPLNVIPASTQ